MTIKKRPMGADGTSVERRKTRRFPVVIPIEVSWSGADGIAVKEGCCGSGKSTPRRLF